jgi:hypothetical protein
MSDITSVSAGGSAPDTTTKTTQATKKASTDFKDHLSKVSGHKYAKVTSGSHKGEFVNQSGNDRDGQLFKMVERNGHEYHVYGKIVVRVSDQAK